MSKMIQIRNVPDETHREIKSRAAKAGMTLSDYLLREVERITRTPSDDDLYRRAQQYDRPDIALEEIVSWIREDRESH